MFRKDIDNYYRKVIDNYSHVGYCNARLALQNININNKVIKHEY